MVWGGDPLRRRLATRFPVFISGLFVCLVLSGAVVRAEGNKPPTVFCPVPESRFLPVNPINRNGPQPDLVVNGDCDVIPGEKYFYGNVNIISIGPEKNQKGTLYFSEFDDKGKRTNTKTEFWASSIVIENEGAIKARSNFSTGTPFGALGGTLSIYLYGKDESQWDPSTDRFTRQNLGALCKTGRKNAEQLSICGVPEDTWYDNGKTEITDLPGGVTDYFYQYGPLHGDGACSNGATFEVRMENGVATGMCGNELAEGRVGYFGKKVLAVSYGGTLDLKGRKGACYDADFKDTGNPCHALKTDSAAAEALRSAPAWTRVSDGTVLPTDDHWILTDDFLGFAEEGDRIIVTTTDYLPGHSEVFTLAQPPKIDRKSFQYRIKETVQYPHNTTRFGGSAVVPPDQLTYRLANAGSRLTDVLDKNLLANGLETRAAVGLLSRSIRIVSAGDKAGEPFPADDYILPGTDHGYYFGGHMIARQGFEKVNIQGVEFVQMGQGGRKGHYPVHFHKARKTPKDTLVADSSINVSMTRWIVVHSTLGVTLARNIGFKSIGHGFFLEDGTETENKFHSNLGIFARAGTLDAETTPETEKLNPRGIPGILSQNEKEGNGVIVRSDAEYPSVFWISNKWNDFVGNMAAGAGACGSAFWFIPMANNDRKDVSAAPDPMKWSGYSHIQSRWAGTAPLKRFVGNFATSTMHSLQTTGDGPVCHGFAAADAPNAVFPVIRAAKADAPSHEKDPSYYLPVTGFAASTTCPETAQGIDCSITAIDKKCGNDNLAACGTTVIDRYTSSFHWAEGNVSAIWLRPSYWYLMTDSVLTDVQNGGLTMVTGGDYTRSSVPEGYWGVLMNSFFIGQTQRDVKTNRFARDSGPFNKDSGLECDALLPSKAVPNYCVSSREGISMPVVTWFSNQRLLNIYDGPFTQESNVFLDITPTKCPMGGYNGGCIYGTGTVFGLIKDKPVADGSAACLMANVAIGWKQPNGFYYPPAFHSKNLLFDNVPLRHYLIEPLFKAPDDVPAAQDFGQGGTYITDVDRSKKVFCHVPPNLFNGYTSIDRQTVLNDDDGTLTGVVSTGSQIETISVNQDMYFSAPVETSECASGLGPNAQPKNACAPIATEPEPTARTSPYRYVSTVVTADAWRGSKAGYDCTYQPCYGVPLYRQYLTEQEREKWREFGCTDNPQKPECRWPFIRMSGAPPAGRQTMTVDNGKYYIDTTVSEETQRTEHYYDNDPRERTLNVFKKGQEYRVFFVFPKAEIKQTYQIYVGDGFHLNAGSFRQVYIDISGTDLMPKEAAGSEVWATPRIDPERKDILQVDIDFSALKAQLDPTPENGLCRPADFCKVVESTAGGKTEKKCVSALTKDDPRVKMSPRLLEASQRVCGEWAMKEVDCPPAGCPGFAFTLPEGFQAGDQYKRPPPEDFIDWKGTAAFAHTKLAPDNQGGKGRCAYGAKLPPCQ